MRLDDIEMLIAAGRSVAQRIRDGLADIQKELETSSATRLLTAIDLCHTHLAINIVGIFSLYESRLQSTYNWSKPFDEVQKCHRMHGSPNQAEEFENLRLAVKVLKHGAGSSLATLLTRADRLPFKVGNKKRDLYEEGECCPASDLILVTPEMLELYCNAIEKSWSITQSRFSVLADREFGPSETISQV